MVLKFLMSEVRRFGIKASTKNRFLLSFLLGNQVFTCQWLKNLKVIYAEAIIYFRLHSFHDCTFKRDYWEEKGA